MTAITVHPRGWKRPKGYANGVVADGRALYVGGQIGWNAEQSFVRHDLVGQLAQALRNVVAVVEAAGGTTTDIVRLTWYVTDKRRYAASRLALGKIYREVIGDHYPAMTLLEVSALLEDRALVEIEATAVVSPGSAAR